MFKAYPLLMYGYKAASKKVKRAIIKRISVTISSKAQVQDDMRETSKSGLPSFNITPQLRSSEKS